MPWPLNQSLNDELGSLRQMREHHTYADSVVASTLPTATDLEVADESVWWPRESANKNCPTIVKNYESYSHGVVEEQILSAGLNMTISHLQSDTWGTVYGYANESRPILFYW